MNDQPGQAPAPRENPLRQETARKDPVFDAITGNNRVIILVGGLLGMVTAFAASRGLITPNSAIPSFGWIVFGLLVSELVFGYIKKVPPSQLVSMPGRINRAGAAPRFMLHFFCSNRA
jgi:hypothetical protein